MRKKIILFIALLVLIPSILFFITTRHSASAALNFIAKWGTYEPYSGGSTNGKFTNPNGIAIDTAGNIYVVDSVNNRVEVFHADGTYVRQWGSYGNEVGQFNSPQGITTAVLSETTYVYVTDLSGVEKFQTDGTPVQHYGSGGGFGNPGGPFSYGRKGVAVDSSGKVYVADSGSLYLQIYNPDGSYDTSISGFLGPGDVAVDSADNVYVADTGNKKVKKYTSDGTLSTQWDTVDDPNSIAIDGVLGDVYVSDGSNDLVERYNSNGTTLLKQWGSAGSQDGQFSNARGIVVNSAGNVYVSDADNNRVEKFDNNGNYLSKLGDFLPADGAFNTPQGVAVDSSGNVYVADTLNDRIQKFNNSGVYQSQWGTPGTGDNQFTNPTAIAIGPSPGNIYVSDTDNNRIEEFNSSGFFVKTWGTPGTANGEFNSPQGIAVDASGNVYVADAGNDRIEEFSSDGTYVTQWGGVGSNAGEFNNPVGIAIDAANNAYIIDVGNSRVQKFDSSHIYNSQWLVGSSMTGISVGAFDNVYIAENVAGIGFSTAGGKIVEYSSSGAFISSVGGAGGSVAADGRFGSTAGLAVDSSSGNIFVVDSSWNRVQEFNISANLNLGLYFSHADTNFYRGNNNVLALAKVGDTVYVGGASGLEAVNDLTGQQIDWLPALPGGAGPVDALAYSASNKMLYVGTNFGLYEYDTSMGTGTLVPDFCASCGTGGGTIYALKIIGNTLYVGGSFSETISGSDSRQNLASYDISNSTPVLTSWEGQSGQGVDVAVRAFAASDTTLYVGGSFYTVDGTDHPAIAAFNLSSGSQTAFASGGFADGDNVDALAYDNNKVYAGGAFTQVKGSHFNNLVSLDATTGDPITSWVPTPQSEIHTMATEGNYLYVGGGGIPSINVGFAQGYNMQNGKLIDWYIQGAYQELADTVLTTPDALYMGVAINYLSSCPFIFANNGNKLTFEAEAVSAGMLSWGTDLNSWKTNPFYAKTFYPDPVSYSRIPGKDLVPIITNGHSYYDLRATFELNEVDYYDSAVLKVIDHDPSVDAYPDYRNNDAIHTISKTAPPPVSVTDQDGNDVLSKVAHDDNAYWRSKLSSTPTYLQIKLTNDPVTPKVLKLVIKKGKQGDFSNPTFRDKLQYKNENGDFVDVPADKDIFLVKRDGAPDSSINITNFHGIITKVIDLSGMTIKDNEIRLVTTNNKTQWLIDWLAVDTTPDNVGTITDLTPAAASLHYRGVSATEYTNPSDKKMMINQPDYQTLTDKFITNPLTGMATKYGEVKDLLSSVDNQFVIATQGDEINMKFDVPEQAAGSERDFILFTFDYLKPYVFALGDTIGPLPFNNMTRYPYKETEEQYPTSANQTYLYTYNTRKIDGGVQTQQIAKASSLHNSLINKETPFKLVAEANAADLSDAHGNLLADIGGLSPGAGLGYVYLAKFDAIPVPTATPTNTPTPTNNPPQQPAKPYVCSDSKPGTPTNMIINPGPGSGQVTLHWTAPSGPVSDYSITYSDTADTQKWGVVSTGNVTSYVISKLPPYGSFHFWINAVNGCMPGAALDPEVNMQVGTSASSSAVTNSGPVSQPAAGQSTYINPTISPPSSMPASGPQDIVKVGVGGGILTIIGVALLLAL